MPSNNWIDEAAKRITAEIDKDPRYPYENVTLCARIIREEFENQPQELPAIPKGCTPSGPEGAGIFKEPVFPEPLPTELYAELHRVACKGTSFEHVTKDGMNQPLPGRNLGDGQ